MHSPVLECTACLACSPKDNKGRKDKIGAKVEGLQNLGKISVKYQLASYRKDAGCYMFTCAFWACYADGHWYGPQV